MAIETTRDLCLSVADAIREKKGSSDLINPQDFAKEIASIEGGGNGGGGSNVEYLDVTNASDDQRRILSDYAQVVKAESEDGIKGVGLPLSGIKMIIGHSPQVKAVAIEGSTTIKVLAQGQEINSTLSDFLLSQGYDLTTFPRITKEQFYDLNA